jgi:hypothetical protein
VVEHLPGKHKALSSNPSTERERERERMRVILVPQKKMRGARLDLLISHK